MPARPPVNSVIKVDIGWTVGDKAAANILYFSFSPFGPSNDSYVGAVADNVATAVAGVANLWRSTTSFQSVTITDLTSDTAPSAVNASTTPGTRTGGLLPANAALLASYSISRRYRGGHARSYLPWFTQTDLDSPQDWASDSVDAANTAWTNVLNGALTAGGGGFTTTDQVQVSYVSGGAPRVTPLANIINFTQCDVMVASQRRRDGRH